MHKRRTAEVLGYVAGNVRRLRIRAGFTQEQLAELADIDLTYAQRIERGTTNLTVGILAAIADALDVVPGALLRRAPKPIIRRGRPRKRVPRTG